MSDATLRPLTPIETLRAATAMVEKRIAELERSFKQILEMAWRDHKSEAELNLLQEADRLLGINKEQKP